MIYQAYWCLGWSLGIYFSSGILAFPLEKEKMTRIEYIAVFEADISIGDCQGASAKLRGTWWGLVRDLLKGVKAKHLQSRYPPQKRQYTQF